MTAATAAGEGPRGNSDSVCLESAGGWVTLVTICSFFVLSACLCSVPPARRVFQRLLSLLLPQWQSKAIPDPANATWAKSLAATKAELSAPSSPFLPCGFEEPEPSPVEESSAPPEPPSPGDKLVVGSAGSGGHGDWAQESPAEEQQLPELYQRLVGEAMEPPEPEYISNPGTLSPEPVPEPDPSPFPGFPTAFLPAALCCQGTLTLDRVKLSGSAFPR
ncbi:hypothetical protein DV515_00017711 [Chloebia gouldiae]|uniref:Uncharacterized protein n=1 Tax=Chloebia gouldiae TaxID=44316 RepID=A0A3L8Q9M0_CHLGU|nr:hypothetical protein DV515_00017712 [Chloebia gouldiae]RLV63990.1 hypothetical protein DV515_00017711 [Chloebia gouldiae]